MNRKKEDNDKVDKVREDVYSTLKSASQPMATQEIADAISRPWHSIQTRCLRLQIDNKIIGFRVGRINLWQIK